MSVESSRLAGRLHELTLQFTATAPQAVAEVFSLVSRAEHAGAGQRLQLLRQVEMLAHRLNGRAAIYEFAALGRHAAAVESAAAAMLAGSEAWSGRLQALCAELVAALPGGGRDSG